MQEVLVPPSLHQSTAEPVVVSCGSGPSEDLSANRTSSTTHMSWEDPTLVASHLSAAAEVESPFLPHNSLVPSKSAAPRQLARTTSTQLLHVPGMEATVELSTAAAAGSCGQEFKHPCGTAARKRRRSFDTAQTGLTQDLR